MKSRVMSDYLVCRRALGLCYQILVLSLMLAPAASAKEERPRVEDNGTIHVPAFVLSESSFLSDETRTVFRHAREARNKSASQEQNPCPPMEGADRAAMPAIRKCEADAFYKTSLYRSMRERYAVEMTPQDIGGVYAEVFTPKEGIAQKNEKRVLINVHGGGYQGGSRTLGVHTHCIRRQDQGGQH
jgi:epsilon-lactone hydrolase